MNMHATDCWFDSMGQRIILNSDGRLSIVLQAPVGTVWFSPLYLIGDLLASPTDFAFMQTMQYTTA